MRRDMNKIFWVGIVAAVLVTLGLVAAGPAAAQGSTPVVPGAEECEVEPRTIDELVGLLETPATPAADIGDEEDVEEFVLPEGEPADGETTAAITSTMRETFACVNGGDFLAAVALFSDDLVRNLFGEEGGLTAEDLAELAATPEPEADENRIAVLAVREARVLEDGRVGALIDIGSADAPGEAEVDFIVFVEADGGYLIDEIVEGLEDQIPPAAGTPAP